MSVNVEMVAIAGSRHGFVSVMANRKLEMIHVTEKNMIKR